MVVEATEMWMLEKLGGCLEHFSWQPFGQQQLSYMQSFLAVDAASFC